MNVLLSIKPEFARKILRGEKEYEFRRTTFRDPSIVDRVFLYATTPVQRILGFFLFSDVLTGRPEDLWKRCSDASGLEDRQRFMAYFSGADTGFAYAIDRVEPFAEPLDPRQHVDEFRPPISFTYLNGEFDGLRQFRAE